MTVIDTVFKALAPAIPDQVIAGHHADLCIVTVHGLQPKTNDFSIRISGRCGGGWGAKRDEDGVSVTVCINDGDTTTRRANSSKPSFPSGGREIRPDHRFRRTRPAARRTRR